MFTDFKGFSNVSEQVSAELLVAEIDHCFSAFDEIIQRYGLEKIKTVGDAYICSGGLYPSKTKMPFSFYLVQDSFGSHAMGYVS